MFLEEVENQFADIFGKLELNNNSKIAQRRKSAFEKFKDLGVPTVKNEEWKYSSLKKLSQNSYSFVSKGQDLDIQLPFSKVEGIKICFINGIYSEKHSSLDHKIGLFTLQQALEEIPELVEQYFSPNQEEDGMTSLNTALAENGMVLHLPANSVIEKPIIFYSVCDNKTEKPGVQLRNLIIADKNSEAKIVECYLTEGEESSFSNMATEIFVAEEAKIDYYKIQNENDASFHIGTTKVTQKDRSHFYAATVTISGGFVRNNLNLALAGEYIESHMFGLYIPNGSQHIDNHTLVDHQKPNCESNELYKGVLSGKSTGVFNGKIFVRENAQKTNAYQNCKNVLNSDSATMNTKPQLEIWADDVKCSHGTTTGKLDDDAIFYMQSRGISKAEAVKMQLIAFANDVVTQIKIEAIREELEELIHQKLD